MVLQIGGLTINFGALLSISLLNLLMMIMIHNVTIHTLPLISTDYGPHDDVKGERKETENPQTKTNDQSPMTD